MDTFDTTGHISLIFQSVILDSTHHQTVENILFHTFVIRLWPCGLQGKVNKKPLKSMAIFMKTNKSGGGSKQTKNKKTKQNKTKQNKKTNKKKEKHQLPYFLFSSINQYFSGCSYMNWCSQYHMFYLTKNAYNKSVQNHKGWTIDPVEPLYVVYLFDIRFWVLNIKFDLWFQSDMVHQVS